MTYNYLGMLLLVCASLSACFDMSEANSQDFDAQSSFLRTWGAVEARARSTVARASAEEYFASAPQIALAEAAAAADLVGIDNALEQGADLNAVGEQGITPLFWSMIKQSFPGYKYLLEKGADPNLATSPPGGQGFRSPMEFAAAIPDTRYLEAALEHGGNPNIRYSAWSLPVIYRAVVHGRLENVQALVEHGAEINYQDKSGGTAILEAVTARKFQIALYLLRQGADPTLTLNRSGSSAVDFVRKYGNRGMDSRSDDFGAFDQFVQALKARGLLQEDPPRFE